MNLSRLENSEVKGSAGRRGGKEAPQPNPDLGISGVDRVGRLFCALDSCYALSCLSEEFG